MRFAFLVSVATMLVSLAACEELPALPDGGADATAGKDAGVHGDAAIDGDISCGVNAFPAPERGCASAADCVAVEHQINCCGTLRAIGISAGAEAAFEQSEAACRDSYAPCRCAQQITMAEDGTSSDGTHPARALCRDGRCTSTFTGADPGVCTPASDSCGPGFSCCYPCGIEGCDFRCEPSCSEGQPACSDGCLLRP